MRFLILILAVIIIFPFSSCRKGERKKFYNDKNQLVMQEYFPDGLLKSELTYLDKKKKSYRYMYYFEDGILKDSGMVINDSLHGLRKFYEKSAGLMHYEEYEHGLITGMDKAVYPNGVCSFTGTRKKGTKTGEWRFHYPDGRPITYEIYDQAGKLRYFRKYDEKGKLIKSSGSSIINVVPLLDTIYLGDTLRGYVEVATPPSTEAILAAGFIENNRLTRSVTYPVDSSKVGYSLIFTRPGANTLNFSLKIMEKNSSNTDQTNFNKNIFVKAK